MLSKQLPGRRPKTVASTGKNKMADQSLPYGVGDLNPNVVVDKGPPKRIRCFVEGCTRYLRPPTKKLGTGEACPEHGIYCHSSGTYSYQDVRRNIIASPELFAERVVGHPSKYESGRLGSENSEDALSWNVFRSLQEAGALARAAKLLTGEDLKGEPDLYLWGIRVSDDSLEPWPLLLQARERFESNLPVIRPQTEPDIALYLPGAVLVLIEAKFTSPNGYYTDGPRRNEQSLTKTELLDIYQDPQLGALDLDRARKAERVFYQLWRNMVFAEWMAKQDGGQTRAHMVSLTRAGKEMDSCQHFRQMLQPDFRDWFHHESWESIRDECVRGHPQLRKLLRFLEDKTASLRPAFSQSQPSIDI